MKKINLTTDINVIADQLNLNAFKDIDEINGVDENTKEIIYQLLIKQKEIVVDRKINRMIKTANFPIIKSINTFELNKEMYSDLNINTIQDLENCEFIKRHQDVVVIGPPGFGKTHLATGIGLEAIHKGFKVLYKTAAQIIDEMDEAESELKLSKYKTNLYKCDLLIIDDMGYINHKSKTTKYLFDIINMRHEQKSTFVISNLIFSEWTKNLKDTNIMNAIIDRLSYNSKIIFIDNKKGSKKSYRYMNSLSKKRINK